MNYNLNLVHLFLLLPFAGIAGVRNDALDLNVQLNDASRIIYAVRHLYRLNRAIK